MNNKYFDLNKYKSGRMALLFVGIFTAVNCVLQATNANRQFLYAATLPQVGMAFTDIFANEGISPVITITVLTIIPILLYFICYFLSKNNTKWMTVGLILFIVDTIVLVFFWFLAGFSMEYLLNLAFEGLILYELIAAIRAGKRLGGNLDEVEEQMKEEIANDDRMYYCYDKQYAKEHKASKGGVFMLVMLGYFALMVLGAVLLLNSESPAVFALFTALMIASVALLVFGMIRISPYASANTFVFYKEDGVVYRTSVANPALSQPLTNLQIFEEKSDAYLCTYEDAKGKQRKMTIPKAYPDIEDIIR